MHKQLKSCKLLYIDIFHINILHFLNILRIDEIIVIVGFLLYAKSAFKGGCS